MKKYQGKSVSEGIAIGKLRVYSGEQRIIEKRRKFDGFSFAYKPKRRIVRGNRIKEHRFRFHDFVLLL